MVNVVVVGPARSGKTVLAHALVGKQLAGRSDPTTSVSRMAVTADGVAVNVWDTPACVEASVPDIASGVVLDSDVVVVCYDGRQRWSPIHIVHAIGADRCVIFLPKTAAFNVALATETFDLASSFFRLVPVYTDLRAILSDILGREHRPRQDLVEGRMLLEGSV